MAEIDITAGQLAPPACGYANEQQRLNAYAAALIATLDGSLQWQASVEEPTDLDLYWLKLDVNELPVAVLKWSVDNSEWVRWRNVPATDGTVGGTGDAITLTFEQPFNVATAYQSGRQYVFTATADNTTAVTFDVDGTGPVALTKYGGTPLEPGDIQEDQVLVVVTDGSAAQLVNPRVVPPEPQWLTFESANQVIPASGSTVTLPHGFVDGVSGVKPFTVRCVLVRTASGSEMIGTMSVSQGQELEHDMFWSGRRGSEGGTSTYPVFRVRADDVNVYVTPFYPHGIAVIDEYISGNAAEQQIDPADYQIKVYATALNPDF